MVQSVDSITYNLLKGAIDASAARGKVISNNIANVNTPGFKESTVKFEENLQQAVKNNSISLKTTNKRHISDRKDFNSGYTVETDKSTSMRPDGNNVDIEKEMVELSSNNMYYNFLISRINGNISTKRYIISEGRK
ncbi:flagellar basal body rod protein FlgB [Clostridium cylindrosporum]|uniref:Flagellar basal body rod protein FlgB n=1 Tax=Clostridium cylindrosporum DSM 605 TaxID=1121307 RepID=A0A0J8G1R8_CLOCY|nr:flagellar basal body rod protein FlgB [Clostridium cylindrosporum]KMT21696.1 flagellar basal body rod protein FlgB [Clostridium cylindrosporum DSM 605]